MLEDVQISVDDKSDNDSDYDELDHKTNFDGEEEEEADGDLEEKTRGKSIKMVILYTLAALVVGILMLYFYMRYRNQRGAAIVQNDESEREKLETEQGKKEQEQEQEQDEEECKPSEQEPEQNKEQTGEIESESEEEEPTGLFGLFIKPEWLEENFELPPSQATSAGESAVFTFSGKFSMGMPNRELKSKVLRNKSMRPAIQKEQIAMNELRDACIKKRMKDVQEKLAELEESIRELNDRLDSEKDKSAKDDDEREDCEKKEVRYDESTLAMLHELFQKWRHRIELQTELSKIRLGDPNSVFVPEIQNLSKEYEEVQEQVRVIDGMVASANSGATIDEETKETTKQLLAEKAEKEELMGRLKKQLCMLNKMRKMKIGWTVLADDSHREDQQEETASVSSHELLHSSAESHESVHHESSNSSLFGIIKDEIGRLERDLERIEGLLDGVSAKLDKFYEEQAMVFPIDEYTEKAEFKLLDKEAGELLDQKDGTVKRLAALREQLKSSPT